MDRNRSIGMVLTVAGGALALIFALVRWRANEGFATLDYVVIIVGILAAILGVVMLFSAQRQ
jgi:hypothetical protein